MTAQKNEASDVKTVDFEYDGLTWTADADPDLTVIELEESGREAAALAVLLGAEQNKKFREKTRRLSDMRGMIDAYAKAAGTGN